MSEPFDPLALAQLGKSIARELESRSAHGLPVHDRFPGCGIYALYYRGNYEPYALLAEANREQWRIPIYVGRAEPGGSRTGSEFEIPETDVLYRRLREHHGTIKQARNLEIEDFRCRYLVTYPVWIRLAERVLIAEYRPVWNSVVDGFGIHAPGARRGGQWRSKWDVLRPGRPFAEKLSDPPHTAEKLGQQVRDYLSAIIPKISGIS